MAPTINALKQIASSTAGLPEDTYIYKIVPSSLGLSLISSADTLVSIDANISNASAGVIRNLHRGGVTALERVSEDGNMLATAGRDGEVGLWDLRTGKGAGRFKQGM